LPLGIQLFRFRIASAQFGGGADGDNLIVGKADCAVVDNLWIFSEGDDTSVSDEHGVTSLLVISCWWLVAGNWFYSN
jgi:hypothetical protein